MQRGVSRRSSPRSNRSTTGSIWETRMKLDEVKGGIKVFTGEENRGEDEDPISLRSYNLRLRRNKSDGGGGGDRRKRKNWSPPETGKIQSLNSPKIDEETKEIELEIKERRKSFDDKEIDQICDRSLSSTEDPENTPDKQDLDLEIEASPPLMAASSCIVLPPESPLVPLQVEAVTEAQYRMKSIVDLIMWREIPRTAFVFGTGSFLLLSSSYTKDLNFSLVSVLSYVGLVYLASIFFFNSILRRLNLVFRLWQIRPIIRIVSFRGTRDSEEKDSRSMMGEEEAIRIARLLLPYVNELLVNLKALFSGDPETTMKLALILFVLARCGGSITCWSMAKMAFFGVFTIPKICASYSVQLGCFGKFWTERAKDAWDSCQHKKAVATGLFALVWNLSSAFARIWAVFMLLVAVRLYQQRAAAAAAEEEEEEGGEAAVEEKPHRQSGGPPASSEKKRWS